MPRLNKERQKELEPKRVEFCKEELENMGIEVTRVTDNIIQFIWKNKLCTLFPYSGWHTGKTIKDGRGWEKLKKQLVE